MEQDDHRAGRLLDDLLDQAERMLGALAESDERDVGSLAAVTGPTSSTSISRAITSCPRATTIGTTQLQAILPLVGDQNA